MAASVLGVEEKAVLSSDCHCKIFERGDGQKGTVFFTSANRVVFVISSGLLSKTYKRAHSIDVGNVANARIEEGAFGLGRSLVIEWNCEGTPLTYRYGSVVNPEEWVRQITEKMQAAKQVGKAYERVIRLLKAQETTPFEEIEQVLTLVQPDLANKTPVEKKLEIVDFLSKCIDQGLIEGLIDSSGKQFTNLISYKEKAGTRKEVITEKVVMVPCTHCGNLMPNTALQCPNCGARKRA